MGTTRENKVLAPIQNLNNKREKDTKITVSKSCHLVDLQKVLIENNWLDFCINKLWTDRVNVVSYGTVQTIYSRTLSASIF